MIDPFKSSWSSGYFRPTANNPKATKQYSYSIGPTLPSTNVKTPVSQNSGGSSLDKTYSSQKKNIDNFEARRTKEAEDARKLLQKQVENEYQSTLGRIGLEESNLQSMLGSYAQQEPILQNQIMGDYQAAKGDLTTSEGGEVANLQGQQQAAEQGAGSAMSKARQAYNELLSGASRFQGSAQGAYGELLGRSAAQGMGDIQNTLLQTTNAIRGEISRTQSYYTRKRSELESAMNNKISEARLNFQNAKAEINNKLSSLGLSRSEADRARSYQNLAALQQFQSQVNNIKSAADESRTTLDQWFNEKQATLADAANRAVKTFEWTYNDVQNYLKNFAQGTVPTSTVNAAYGLVGKEPTQEDLNKLWSGASTSTDLKPGDWNPETGEWVQ